MDDATRPARRKARRLAHTPVAQIREAMQDVGRMTYPGEVALRLVRETLAQFEIPAQVTVRNMGARRVSGFGGHGVREGQVDVLVTLRPRTGATTEMMVPLQVRDGEMLQPSVGFIHDEPYILAQSTFDDILARTAISSQGRHREMERAEFLSLWASEAQLSRDVDIEGPAGRRRLTSGLKVAVLQSYSDGILIRTEDGTRALVDADDLA